MIPANYWGLCGLTRQSAINPPRVILPWKMGELFSKTTITRIELRHIPECFHRAMFRGGFRKSTCYRPPPRNLEQHDNIRRPCASWNHRAPRKQGWDSSHINALLCNFLPTSMRPAGAKVVVVFRITSWLCDYTRSLCKE